MHDSRADTENCMKCGFSYETDCWGNYCEERFWMNLDILCRCRSLAMVDLTESCTLTMHGSHTLIQIPAHGTHNFSKKMINHLKIPKNMWNVYGKMCTVAQFLAPILVAPTWNLSNVYGKTCEMCTVNVYGKTCTVSTTKKLGSTSPLFSTFYTSPTLISTNKISPTLQTNIRSIFSSSPMGMGPSSLELPNQLILQTGHRNAEAKTASWTPNATQRLQMDLLLRLANSTSLVPTQHGAQPRRTRKPEMVHLISPPLQFTKQ